MSKKEEEKKLLLAIRIRGKVGVRRSIKETLEFLRLFKVNHAVLLDTRKSYKGMLQKAKDYITWGQIDKETLNKLIMKRGKLLGNKEINDDHLKKYSKFNNIKEFSDAVFNLKTNYNDLPYIKPIFRLHPPKKGFKYKKKRPFKDFGELGNRDTEINSLILRMI